MFLAEVPAKARRACFLDASSGLFHGIYMGGILPFLGVIARQQFGASAFLISLIAAAPFIGFLAAPFWARRVEKGDRKVLMIVCCSVFARIVFMTLAFAHNSYTFVAISLIATVVPPFCMPAYTALIKDIFPDEWRGRLLALIRVPMTTASMLASAGVGWALTHWSFHLVLPAIGLIALIGPFAFYIRIPEPKHTPPKEDEFSLGNLSILKQDPLFAKYSLAFFIFGFGTMMLMPLVPLLQVDELHITSQWVGALATITALATGVSFYFWGKVVDRQGPLACTYFAIISWGVVALGYALAPSLIWLIPIALINGLANSATDLALINVVLQFSPPGSIPRYSSVHYTLTGIRGLVAPILGAALLDFISLRAAFAACAGLIVVGFFILLHVLKAHRLQPRPTTDTLAELNEIPGYE